MNSRFSEISILLQKEWAHELKSKHSIGSVILFVLSTVMVVYLTFSEQINQDTWVSLFWVIMLFASLNSVSNSFLKENTGNQLYTFTLVSPYSLILSKILFNTTFVFCLSALCYGMFVNVFNGIETPHLPFLLLILLGSFGYSATLTLVSAIAVKSGNNATMISILSFPIILPFILSLAKTSEKMMESGVILFDKNLMIVIALDILVLALSYLLFPYLWRD